MIVQCLRSDSSCFGHYNRSCLLTYFYVSINFLALYRRTSCTHVSGVCTTEPRGSDEEEDVQTETNDLSRSEPRSSPVAVSRREVTAAGEAVVVNHVTDDSSETVMSHTHQLDYRPNEDR